ncbi:MAG: AlkA N-terminal domain-containing protein [Ornithinimicrobium sp.]
MNVQNDRVMLTTEARLAAVRSRDPRFDGYFYFAVRSTGIYCRPSCPSRSAKPANLRFYPSAAAAQVAGYRACKRCRPDAIPGSPRWQEPADTVSRLMRLIADGVVDREGVEGLSRHIGYSARQVERLLVSELGAGPVALARAQRAQAARVLIETTQLSMADVAFAAGFASIRSFNDTVRAVFDATPSQLRHHGAGAAEAAATGRTSGGEPAIGHRIVLRLPYRAPLHTGSLFGHLAATAVPGVEAWIDGGLARSIELHGGPALVHLRPADGYVAATVTLTDLRDLTSVLQRCRRMLDLDADPHASDEHLARDPALAPLVRERPGVRLPGAMDPAEMALRIVLSQHISTKAAATLTARLVATLGTALTGQQRQIAGIDHLFPAPEIIANADPDQLPGMPPTRALTLQTLSAALANGALDVRPGADWSHVQQQLLAIRGVGEWTAHMVGLRAVGDPDAFPATDLGVRRTAAAHGLPADRKALIEAAKAWQPWRGYATQALWAASGHAAAALPVANSPWLPVEPTAPATTPRAEPSHIRSSEEKH